MRSLILKDLYNIGHNAKSMLFVLVVFANNTVVVTQFIFSFTENDFALMNKGNVIGNFLLCSMMIVTTFTFDDNSKWTRYSMIMPVSKKDLVGGKFVVLAIFCLIGI